MQRPSKRRLRYVDMHIGPLKTGVRHTRYFQDDLGHAAKRLGSVAGQAEISTSDTAHDHPVLRTQNCTHTTKGTDTSDTRGRARLHCAAFGKLLLRQITEAGSVMSRSADIGSGGKLLYGLL